MSIIDGRSRNCTANFHAECDGDGCACICHGRLPAAGPTRSLESRLPRKLGELVDACDGNYRELTEECNDLLDEYNRRNLPGSSAALREYEERNK